MFDYENENLLFDMAISNNLLAYNPLYQQCLYLKNEIVKNALGIDDVEDESLDAEIRTLLKI